MLADCDHDAYSVLELSNGLYKRDTEISDAGIANLAGKCSPILSSSTFGNKLHGFAYTLMPMQSKMSAQAQA